MRFFKAIHPFRTRYEYSDLGYGLLSYITEYIGGDTWENLMKKHIFKALDMTRTTFTHVIDDRVDDVFQPVYKRDGKWIELSKGLIK
jgi:CubicO group peptidase (beta-lactamase class C family)